MSGWKKYGGTSQLEKTNNLTVKSLVTDNFSLRKFYLGDWDICGGLRVKDNAIIYKDTDLCGNLIVGKDTTLIGEFSVSKDTNLYGNLVVLNDASTIFNTPEPSGIRSLKEGSTVGVYNCNILPLASGVALQIFPSPSIIHNLPEFVTAN